MSLYQAMIVRLERGAHLCILALFCCCCCLYSPSQWSKAVKKINTKRHQIWALLLVCLQELGMKLWKTLIFFPLTYLSQRSVWFLCSALVATTQSLERLWICYMVLKAIFHECFRLQLFIILILTFSCQWTNLEAGIQTF